MCSKNKIHSIHQNPPFECLCLQLQWAPEGYHSVCGTESDQQVPIVKFHAAKGDRMAQALLDKGDVYGKQFVTFESNQAYPAYVVTYNYPDNLPPNVFTDLRTQVVVIVVGHAFTVVSRTPIPLQRPMKWEHKAASEKSWTDYSPKHTRELTQVIMSV